MLPAINPPNNERTIDMKGFIPFIIEIADIDAPVVKVLSTERSGKSKILKDIYIPRPAMENIRPWANVDKIRSVILIISNQFAFL